MTIVSDISAFSAVSIVSDNRLVSDVNVITDVSAVYAVIIVSFKNIMVDSYRTRVSEMYETLNVFMITKVKIVIVT